MNDARMPNVSAIVVENHIDEETEKMLSSMISWVRTTLTRKRKRFFRINTWHAACLALRVAELSDVLQGLQVRCCEGRGVPIPGMSGPSSGCPLFTAILSPSKSVLP